MAGIYIHIPYCHQKCHYCDFYSTIDLKHKDKLVDAICKEIELRQGYLSGEQVETIYFGGGTPSALNVRDIETILKKITSLHQIVESPEITIEVNPDDVSFDYFNELKSISVNRLSIGVQAFYNEYLELMNRRHNADQADKSIEFAKVTGFENISIDLIYGIPGMTFSRLKKTIDKAIDLDIPHISAYHLTIEPRTIFDRWLREGKIRKLDDDISWEHYSFLANEFIDNRYDHYEISNFARDSKYSKHNTAYWKGHKYLGVGPSAHSFNHISRQWNVPDIHKYIKEVNTGEVPCTKEPLTNAEKFNDYVITGLRTKWGIDLNHVFREYGSNYYNHCQKVFSRLFYLDTVELLGKNIVLTQRGFFVSDSIFREFVIA